MDKWIKLDKTKPAKVFTTKVKKGNYNLMVHQNQGLNSIRLVGLVTLVMLEP